MFESLLVDKNSPGPSNVNTSSSQCEINFITAPKPNPTPWAEKKFGYTPFPKTDRAKFLNDNVLPYFYKCQWQFSKNARSFQQKFHSEGRRQYDHHTKLSNIEESFKVWTERLPDNNNMKPTDLRDIQHKTEYLEHLIEKLQKVRDSIQQDDSSNFTRAGKLKSGQECAHKFNETCFGTITNLKSKMDESLKKMQTLAGKHKRMYPMARGGTASKKRRQKENRAKSRKRKMEREDKNCQRVFSLAVTSSLSYGDTVKPDHLNKEGISQMGKHDIRWLKSLFNKSMFTQEAMQVCNALNHYLETDTSDTDTDDDAF